MQAIPAIIENRIVPAIGSFKKAPMKKPTIPAMTIIMTDATVLNFFINNFPPSIPIEISPVLGNLITDIFCY